MNKKEMINKQEQNRKVKEAFQAIEIIEDISKKIISGIDFDSLVQDVKQVEKLRNLVYKNEFNDEELMFIEWLHKNTSKTIYTFMFEDIINHWNKHIETASGKNRYDILKGNDLPPRLKNLPSNRNIDGSIDIIETFPHEKTYIRYTIKPAYYLYNIEQGKFESYSYLSDVTGSGTYSKEDGYLYGEYYE